MNTYTKHNIRDAAVPTHALVTQRLFDEYSPRSVSGASIASREASPSIIQSVHTRVDWLLDEAAHLAGIIRLLALIGETVFDKSDLQPKLAAEKLGLHAALDPKGKANALALATALSKASASSPRKLITPSTAERTNHVVLAAPTTPHINSPASVLALAKNPSQIELQNLISKPTPSPQLVASALNRPGVSIMTLPNPGGAQTEVSLVKHEALPGGQTSTVVPVTRTIAQVKVDPRTGAIPVSKAPIPASLSANTSRAPAAIKIAAPEGAPMVVPTSTVDFLNRVLLEPVPMIDPYEGLPVTQLYQMRHQEGVVRDGPYFVGGTTLAENACYGTACNNASTGFQRPVLYDGPREIFSSNWLKVELMPMDDGIFGETDISERPFRIRLNSQKANSRVQLSALHEMLHVMNSVFKLNLTHQQVHDVAVFFTGDVVPAVLALQKALYEP